ncbi:restriction endonuclease subunit S [Anaerovibrio lipolyticus]|uniref:restriction endonuclease subunit S n=1 Tax=Anaerovibrio lipolyticus TaxID=82374 RepID=UPI001F300547|nr:restriction endonuclease subunit S [Anaerovibrio lipolyticus]MCF2600824.1 restriction endonuclease subunit S [Anaerovibrio lipolyticus]
MAKKKEKTLEEKLQEALVPENQWPYILPENWCWTRLGKITNVVGGGTPSSSKKEYYDNGTIPWLSPADLSGYSDIYISRGQKNITELGLSKSSARLMPKDTVLLSSRAPIGYVAIASNSISTNQGFKNFLPSDAFYSRFLYWYLKSSKSLLESYASGTTFLELSGSKASMVEFPLPPLPEQKRIVHRIESLFAKLDEAKEKIQQVLDGAEMRKVAILHKAFTGELTKNWRKENGISEDSWVEYTLQSVCTMKITDGTHKTPTYSDKENGVVFLSAKDITSGEINWENTKYITSELHKELYSRLAPQINDILLAKNGTTGVAALVKEDKVFDIYVTLALLRPNVEIVIPEYLLNIINSPLCKVQFNENLTGIGVPNLHLRDIKDVKIKVPSISEQEIISDKVEMLLANEGMVTKNCLKQIEVIDTMKKSILAKAFRGELGTNNPNEDSAINLLKEVLQDKF